MEILLILMGVAFIAIILKPSKKAATNGGFIVGMAVKQVKVPVLKVLFWLVKASLAYAVFVGIMCLYLATYPPFWVEWWCLTFLINLLAFCVACSVGMPKEYRLYLDQKPEKGGHSALDYLVGLVMSALMLPGLAMPVAILATSPDWKFV